MLLLDKHVRSRVDVPQRENAGPGALDTASAYVAALQRNGNILSDWIMTVNDGGWTVYGVAPDKDAFRKSAQSDLVRKRLTELKSANIYWPRTRFLNNVAETARACRCRTPDG